MSVNSSPYDLPENLTGFARLGADASVDVRHVLLRVLTDLFVSRVHHDFDQIRQFEAVALGLLERTDPDTKVIVAKKLSECGATPQVLAERLVADGGPAAAHILARSTVLPRAWILSSALGEKMSLAVAVAQRVDLDSELCETLIDRPESEVWRALAANPVAPITPPLFRKLVSRGIADRQLGVTLCARAANAHDIAPLFLYASHMQRAAILLDARRADLGSTRTTPNTIEASTAAEIEAAAIAHDMTLMAAIMARALDAPINWVHDIIGDSGGEAIAVLLSALHVDANAAARILMCLHEKIAHNAARVFALTALLSQIAPVQAMRLVDAMMGDVAPMRDYAKYQAVTDAHAAAHPSRPQNNARSANRSRGSSLLFLRRKA